MQCCRTGNAIWDQVVLRLEFLHGFYGSGFVGTVDFAGIEVLFPQLLLQRVCQDAAMPFRQRAVSRMGIAKQCQSLRFIGWRGGGWRQPFPEGYGWKRQRR